MNNKWTKRIWSWIMIGCMLFTMVPALAEDAETAPAEPQVVEEPAPAPVPEPVPEPAPAPEPEPEPEPAPQAPAEPPVVEEPPVEEAPAPEAPAEPAEPVEPSEPEVVPPVEDAPEAEEPEVEDEPSAEAPGVDGIRSELIMEIAEPAPETEVIWSGGFLAVESKCEIHNQYDTVQKVKDAAAAGLLNVDVELEPNCATEENGYSRYTCPNPDCDSKCFIVDTFAHTDDPIATIREATCTDPGEFQYKCSTCGRITQRDGDAPLPHNWIPREVVKEGDPTLEPVEPANCVRGARLGMYCEWCYKKAPDDIYRETYGEKLGHKWNKLNTGWVDFSDNTDVDKFNKVTYQICERPDCPGWNQGDGTDATGLFTFDINNPDTYKKYQGTQTTWDNDANGIPYTTYIGRAERYVVHNHSNHDYKFEWKDATCTADGKWTAKCTVCDRELSDAEIQNFKGSDRPVGKSKNKLGHAADTTDTWKQLGGVGIDHRMYRLCKRCGAWVGDNDDNPKTADTTDGELCSSESHVAAGTWHATAAAATCQLPAGTYYHCDLCGYDYFQAQKGSKPDPKAHAYDKDYEGNIVVATATCSSRSEIFLVCKLCGHVDETSTQTQANGHRFVLNAEKSVQPTCEKPGILVYECVNPRCPGLVTTPGTSEDEDKNGPVDEDSADGKTTYSTDAIDGFAVKQVRVEKLGHTFDDKYNTTAGDKRSTAVVTPPTCQSDGYTTWTCDVCGATKVTDRIKASPDYHKKSATTKQLTATCTQPARDARFCEYCGATLDDYDPVEGSRAKGHTLVPMPDYLGTGANTHRDVNCYLGWQTWVCVDPNCPGAATSKNTRKETDTVASAQGLTKYTPFKTIEEFNAYLVDYGTWTTNSNGKATVNTAMYVNDDGTTNGHRFAYKTVSATCTTPEMSGYYCEICGKAYATGDDTKGIAVNGGTLTDACIPTQTGDKLGHQWSEWIQKDVSALDSDAANGLSANAWHVHIKVCNRPGCQFNNYDDSMLSEKYDANNTDHWKPMNSSGEDDTIRLYEVDAFGGAAATAPDAADRTWVVANPGNCKTPASVTYTCNDCGWTKTVNAWHNLNGAGDTDDTYTVDFTNHADPINMNAHVFDKTDPSTIVWEHGQDEATCVTPSIGWYKCIVCGSVPKFAANQTYPTTGPNPIRETNEVTGDKSLRHVWEIDDTFAASDRATCLKAGTVRYICKVEGCPRHILHTDETATDIQYGYTSDSNKYFTKTKPEAPLGHAFDTTTVTVPAPGAPGKLIDVYLCTREGCDGAAGDGSDGADGVYEGKAFKAAAGAYDCPHTELLAAIAEGTVTPSAVVSVANCVEQAVGTFHCEACDTDQNLPYGELDPGHHKGPTTHVEDPVPATCTQDGHHGGHICDACGKPVNDSSRDPAKGHTWERNGFDVTDPANQTAENGWAVVTEATCSAVGSGTFTCTDPECDKVDNVTTVEIPMIEHTWDEGKVTNEGDCITPVETTYTCTVCGETKVEQGDVNYAKHVGPITDDPPLDPTCTKPGHIGGMTCQACSRHTIDEHNLDPLGHTWEREGFDINDPANQTVENGFVVLGAGATCLTAGTGYFECTDPNCDAPDANTSNTVEIPALGHDFTGAPEQVTDSVTGETVTAVVCGNANCDGAAGDGSDGADGETQDGKAYKLPENIEAPKYSIEQGPNNTVTVTLTNPDTAQPLDPCYIYYIWLYSDTEGNAWNQRGPAQVVNGSAFIGVPGGRDLTLEGLEVYVVSEPPADLPAVLAEGEHYGYQYFNY